ncbi:MAG TPA: hypothetical protein G4O03_08355 [Dehalococcoidia bacterium]|jgi:hypothetical protein|nr:hypothetical protein [Dehalococcoidia bacterium]
MDENLVKKLMSRIKCGLCGKPYAMENIQILGHRDDLWFVGMFCTACRSHGLVAAVIREGQFPEVYSELSDEELKRFSQGEVVGANDVLEMHDFLKGFDGDFSRLFSRR